MWRLYLKLGLKEDFIEFEDMRECMRLADRMKKAYPWYTIKVRRVSVCG